MERELNNLIDNFISFRRQNNRLMVDFGKRLNALEQRLGKTKQFSLTDHYERVTEYNTDSQNQ